MIHKICTIGYEGKSLDQFLSSLGTHGIVTVVDVRKNPISRKKGFSKTTLASSCKAIGVEYIHKSELGIPAKLRTNLKSYQDYTILFQYYITKILPKEEGAISEISALAKNRLIALLCFENDPMYCHRKFVAEEVGKRISASIHHL